MFKSASFCLLYLLIAFLCKGQQNNNTNQFSDTMPAHAVIMVDSAYLKAGIFRDYYFHDSLYFGHPVYLNKPITTLTLTRPVMLVQADSNQIPYFIYPGDTIMLKAINHGNPVFYVKDNEQKTNELNFFRLLINTYGQVYGSFKYKPYQTTVANGDALLNSEQAIFAIKQARLNFLDSFAGKLPVSTQFYTLAANFIKGVALKDTLLLYSNNRVLLQQAGFKKLVTEKINSAYQPGFQPYFINQSAYITLISLLTTKYESYELQDSSDVAKRALFAEENISGLLRDFILARTLCTAYSKGIPVPVAMLKNFYDNCTDSGYKRMVVQKFSEKTAPAYPRGTSNLLLLNGSVNPLQSVLSKYKGKVILLDFWASWCGPCRKELPYSKTMAARYKANNIAFIYISLDENADDWKAAVADEGLTKENCYLMLSAEKSSFAAQYGIQSIPRYMLLNEDGKIVNTNAPRPSDPMLTALLAKYLQ